jgi:PIN domain nuclease of toxin-antitoxin system
VTLLLDTNVLIWWLEGTLADAATAAVSDPVTPVWVSAVSVWEVAIKTSIGRFRSPDDLPAVIVEEGFRPLPITHLHAQRVRDLPFHHRDPFDRLLVAQAQAEDLTLVTGDAALAAYDVRVLSC